MEVQVKVVNNSPNELPAYATEAAAGMDIRAWLDPENSKPKCLVDASFDYWDGVEGKEADWVLTIPPGSRALIPTGIHIKLPKGYEAQIRPRSGLALKHGITVVNTPGTIDAE